MTYRRAKAASTALKIPRPLIVTLATPLTATLATPVLGVAVAEAMVELLVDDANVLLALLELGTTVLEVLWALVEVVKVVELEDVVDVLELVFVLVLVLEVEVEVDEEDVVAEVVTSLVSVLPPVLTLMLSYEPLASVYEYETAPATPFERSVTVMLL